MIRDLGGLMLEMYRHEQFREDLIEERCREIVNLEARIYELDSMLSAVTASRAAPAGRCACGAPVIWGSHFCANCGRPVGGVSVVSCAQCGHPLAADAEFCPSCGKAAEVPEEEQSVVQEVVENGAGAKAEQPEGESEPAEAAAESWDS
jgi:membrane protease subunit (stomatin/prohibitin family)